MSSSTNANFPPVCIRARIPRVYQRQPLISRLISRYNLTINIAAALVGNYSHNYAWFDLELQGSSQKVEAGLAYLQELKINVFQLTLKSLIEARMKKSQCLGISSEIDVPIEQMHIITTEDGSENDLTVEAGQTIQMKVQVCIPHHYRIQPVISGLVSHYGLTTNITNALLDADTEDDGWFDLELWGRRAQMFLALGYLEQLGLQVWF